MGIDSCLFKYEKFHILLSVFSKPVYVKKNILSSLFISISAYFICYNVYVICNHD